MNSQRLKTICGAVGVACFGIFALSAPAQTLLLHYNFDEAGSGNENAVDAGDPPAAPGVFSGTAGRTNNTPGGYSRAALDLTGEVPHHVTPPEEKKTDALSRLTLTTWLNLQGDRSGFQRLMSRQGSRADFPGFSWMLGKPTLGPRSAASFNLRLFIGGIDAFSAAGSTANVNADNRWVFLAVTYDSSLLAENVRFYLGDERETVQLLGEAITLNAGPIGTAAARFHIGHTDAAPDSDFAPPGFMDDVRVYNGALEPGELEKIRKENLPGETPAGVDLTHGLMRTSTGKGYWIFSSDGDVRCYGDAKFFGSAKEMKPEAPVVGMAVRPEDDGYWLTTAKGVVFSFGTAFAEGSATGLELNQPIIGIVSPTDGEGYWLFAKDGGIFAYGSALFRGGTAEKAVNNIVGMAATTNNCYWLLGADGLVYNFDVALNEGVTNFVDFVGMAAKTTSDGYWLARANGEVHGINAPDFPKAESALNVTGIARGPSDRGYWLITGEGKVHAFGDAVHHGDPTTKRPGR